MTMSASDKGANMNQRSLRPAADDVLADEAAVLSRYLVGHSPDAELIARYIQAERRFGGDLLEPRDETLVRWARRRPWSLGPLDSACGLFRPHSALRAKMLRMAAILEASPGDAESFLPAERRLLRTMSGLVATALSAVLEVSVGLALLCLLARGDHREART